MRQSSLLCWWARNCLALMLAVFSTACWGQDVSEPIEPDRYRSVIAPFFREHCLACHGPELVEGELRLDLLEPNFSQRQSLGHWVEVLDRINLGEMPPEDEPRPAAEQLATVVDWITKNLQVARTRGDSTDGQVLLRRLSRLEYANTVRDLFRVQFVAGEGPLDRLPPDGSIGGFDRNSKALLTDPSLLEAYLQVGQEVADLAVQFRPPLVPEKTVRFEFRDTDESAMSYLLKARSAYLEDGKMVVMEGGARTFGVLRHPYNNTEVPITGDYRVRIRAAADPGAAGKPVYMNVRQGPSDSIAQFRVDATKDSPQIYEFVTTRDQLFQGEYQVGIVDGTSFTRYVGERGDLVRAAQELFDSGDALGALKARTRLRAQGDFDTNTRGAFHANVLDLKPLPKLYLDWIEVTGPLQGEFPPASMTWLFPDGWDGKDLDLTHAREIIRKVLPRAYRRPVHDSEIDEVLSIVQAEWEVSDDFQAALESGFVAILCSPHFLFLAEPADGRERRQLNDFELATRLSYLLWSSMPDDDLFRLASQHKLSDPIVLAGQVDRMLADPRSQGFLDGFIRRWLKIDEFERFPADERIFPQYHETAMKGIERDVESQPLEFIRETIRSDRPVTDLMDSDWTVVNERLAAWYGIPDVTGDQFQRVSLAGHDADGMPLSIRGGLIGMAGVHRWGSDGNRTKPVERGKYILDVFFNDPPPPPPPNAGEVEPNLRGQQLTVRQRLSLHREQVTCNNCHRRIDPYGLALENFNVIGLWRDRVDGEKPIEHWGQDRPEIDVSGRLPGGDEFADFFEFKHALRAQEDRFLRGLTEKLLTYALARTIESSDRGMVDQIVAGARSQGLSFRAILKQLVVADAFQTK